jgi:hypothetical protein
LCDSVYYVNWAVPFDIVTPDEIDKDLIILSQRKDTPLCVKCVDGMEKKQKQMMEEEEEEAAK